MASTHKHIRSGTANKRPTTAIADGQIALNTNSTSPGLFFKDSTGATIIKIGPVHVGSTAPNATPAAGGSSGNSTGEIWLDNSLTPVGVKIWNGSAWVNATPVGSTTVQGLLELATSAETQTGTDTDRAVTPAGLQSKVSDSTSTTSSTTIASSTAVKSAYDLANAALPKSGGTVTGNLEIGTTGSLSFEGATADAFETTIAVTDPTADRTITLPDTTGTVVTTGDTGTVTSTMIADGTIVNGDINASAAIAHTKLANITAGSVLLGNASNVPTATALTGDVTISSSGVTAIGSGVIVNADVNASAAIAGTKISPDFGSQNTTTTGTSTAASFIPTSSTAPTNGVYLPSANNVAISTNGSERVKINSTGELLVGTSLTSIDGNWAVQANASASGVRGVGINNNGGYGVYLTYDNTARYSGGACLRNVANSLLAFETNNTERFRVRADGTFEIKGGGTAGVTPAVSVNPSASANSLVIDSSGRVGLGTSSPAAQLHVAAQDGTIYQQATRGTGTTWRLQTSGANGQSYELYDLTNSQRAFIYQGATGAEPGWTFNTAGSARMYIDNSGRVGIGTGTSSPGTLFQVKGNGVNTVSLQYTSDAGSVGYGFYNSAGTELWSIGGGRFVAQDALEISRQGSLKFVINSSGNVGIGTTPVAPLDVKVASDAKLLFQDGNTANNVKLNAVNNAVSANTNLEIAATNTLFFQGGSEKARLTSDGKLLVGTSSARSNVLGSSRTPQFQIEGASSSVSTARDLASLSIIGGSATGASDAGCGNIRLARQGSNTVGGLGGVGNNEAMGVISFLGCDGTNFIEGAQIRSEVDGTAGVNDLPSRLVFSVTRDGAASPTEALRIRNNGTVMIGTTSVPSPGGPTTNAFVASTSANDGGWTGIFQSTGASSNRGVVVSYSGATPNDSFNEAFFFTDATAVRFSVKSNGGINNYSANNANLSDRNTKKNIAPAAGTWDCLKEWEIVNYRYKDQADDADLNMGVIAQQVAESCPEVITVFQEATEDQPEKLGVKEQQMMWMAIKALQEAQLRIETLEAEVAALKGV